MVKAGIAIDICERDYGILPEHNGGISMKKFCVTITKFNPFDITLCFQ